MMADHSKKRKRVKMQVEFTERYLVMFYSERDKRWVLLCTHHSHESLGSARDAVNEYRRGPESDVPFRIVKVVQEYR